MNAYEIGVKLALDEVGLTKTAGNLLYNPIWASDDPRPWHQIALQNLGSGTAMTAAGLGGGLAGGYGGKALVKALKGSPKAQLAGAIIGALGGGLGAGIPVGQLTFDALA